MEQAEYSEMACFGPVTIRPADYVDITYVAANMRAIDRRELTAISPVDDALSIATLIWERSRGDTGETWGAYLSDQPVAMFGVALAHPGTYHGWMFGTRRTWRVVPAISRFRRVLERGLYKSGVQRVEVRALEENETATRWLVSMGAQIECRLPCFGKTGEPFVQLAWVRDNVLLLNSESRAPSTGPACASSASAPRTSAHSRSSAPWRR